MQYLDTAHGFRSMTRSATLAQRFTSKQIDAVRAPLFNQRFSTLPYHLPGFIDVIAQINRVTAPGSDIFQMKISVPAQMILAEQGARGMK